MKNLCSPNVFDYKITPVRGRMGFCWGVVVLKNGSEIDQGSFLTLNEARDYAKRRIEIETEECE
jgi:hypothetical protein